MGRIDNLNEHPNVRLQQQVRKQGTKSGLGRTSVSEGTTEFNGAESLLVKGSATVSGTLTISGLLKGIGELLWEGIVNLTGSMFVKSGGKIVVEGSNAMTLGVGAFGLPGVGFASGGGVSGYTGGAFLHGGSNTIGCIVTPSAAQLSGGINNYVTASATKVSVSGPFETTGVVNMTNLIGNTTTGTTYVVANASTGLLQRVSSASRFKLDQREADLPASLMGVRVKDWLDAGEVATAFELNGAPRPWTEAQSTAFRGLGIRRVPGVVAEDVQAAGGELFNTFDAEGRIEGVAYDRLALARTQILGDQLAEAMRQIELLKDQLAALSSS